MKLSELVWKKFHSVSVFICPSSRGEIMPCVEEAKEICGTWTMKNKLLLKVRSHRNIKYTLLQWSLQYCTAIFLLVEQLLQFFFSLSFFSLPAPQSNALRRELAISCHQADVTTSSKCHVLQSTSKEGN